MFRNKKSGFTIIEVVLVLAIAGLIFLMVFIALPALQRSQRDSQRKNDLGRAISAVQSFQANNRGRAPGRGEFSRIIQPSYLEQYEPFLDPDGSNYRIWNNNSVAEGVMKDSSGDTIIRVHWDSTCDGSDVIVKNGSNNIALTIILEGGGVYCANN
ncbi:MAG: type II secretion system protein [Candidatus Sacchiramonaceae bacterium]|nr:type II secretion system protein [Candidatus Saccharimonadaceae bacterium]